jgi:ADP-heptose:LPS heptosyltransferase
MNNLKKNFIIFRTDKLGDFIIHSRPIFELKQKYKNCNITIVCSDLNKKIISKFTYIDKVITYNKSDNLIKKFNTFFKIISINYHASFILDGKNFSYLCNIFLRSNNKIGVSYKSISKLLFFKFKSTKPSFIYNYFFFNRYETFTSKKYIRNTENFVQKYINLFKEYNIPKISIYSNYIFDSPKSIDNIFEKFKKNLNLNNFVIIHIDEKWKDIASINKDLHFQIATFQKLNNFRIIITGYNNNFNFFNSLRNAFDYHNCRYMNNFSELSNYNRSNILILDNLEIFLFEKFLKNSIVNISCHSGFIAQVCGANNGKIIDIINSIDETWYSCWKPKNTFHKFIYKSNMNSKIPLNMIFSKITQILKNL